MHKKLAKTLFFLIFILTVINFLIPVQPASSQNQSAVSRLRVEGQNILAPDGTKVVLKGINWGWWDTAQSGDAYEAKEIGATVIRMPFRWYFTGDKSDIRETNAPGHINPEGLKLLDQYIEWCSKQKIWVILFGGSDQGAGDNRENYWTNPELRKEFLETWVFLVERYKNQPYIGAYEILSEPHPKKPVTSKDLLQFYEEAIATIRQHDQKTPLIIGPNDHYDINQLPDVYTKKDSNIIYTFNYYLPTEYCKTEKMKEKGLPLVTYPGSFKTRDGKKIIFNRNYLDTLLQPALQFREKYKVPVFINQVGVRSEAPGHLQYLEDVLELFSDYQIHFTYWTYRTRHDQTQHGLYWLDEKGVYHPKSDQIAILKKYFQMDIH